MSKTRNATIANLTFVVGQLEKSKVTLTIPCGILNKM